MTSVAAIGARTRTRVSPANAGDLKESLVTAAAKGTEVCVILHDKNRWLVLRSHVAGFSSGCFWLASPRGPRKPSAPFGAGTQLGFSLRLGSFRYSFLSSVAQVLPSEELPAAVGVRLPQAGLRVDRRTHRRVLAGGKQPVRVAFWPGSKDAPPQGVQPDRPLWCGSAVDISLGGLAVRTSWDAGNLLEPGDIVAARIMFGQDPEPVDVQLQLRHATRDGAMGVLGFVFIDVLGSEEGRATLERIAQKVGLMQA